MAVKRSVRRSLPAEGRRERFRTRSGSRIRGRLVPGGFDAAALILSFILPHNCLGIAYIYCLNHRAADSTAACLNMASNAEGDITGRPACWGDAATAMLKAPRHVPIRDFLESAAGTPPRNGAVGGKPCSRTCMCPSGSSRWREGGGRRAGARRCRGEARRALSARRLCRRLPLLGTDTGASGQFGG